jgi:protein-tyrosine-phosphatase
MANFTPKGFGDLPDSTFDLVITLSPEAHHNAMELTRTQVIEVEYWPTPDPAVISGNRDQIMDGYRMLRDHLKQKIRQRFGTLSAPNP